MITFELYGTLHKVRTNYLSPTQHIRQIGLSLIPFDNVRARTIISFAKLFEERRLSRERKGMPPAPPKDIFKIPDDAVVQVVQAN